MLSSKSLSALMIKIFTVLGLCLALAACGGSSGGADNPGGNTPEDVAQKMVEDIQDDLSIDTTDFLATASDLLGQDFAVEADFTDYILSLSSSELQAILDDLQTLAVSLDATLSAGQETVFNYSGQAPRDADVQEFYLTVWAELSTSDRCGQCHVQGGSATPAFVRNDNINTAYDTAVPALINTTTPASSRLVTKVGEGHNCWVAGADTSVCENAIVGWIQAMASAGGTTSFIDSLNLSDPVDKGVGNSKQFPALADEGTAFDFESTIYPLTSQYCGACHSENSSLQQQPFIGSDDVQVAYEAARNRINVGDVDPANVADYTESLSRLVIRMRDEGHNCWGGNCATSSSAMFDRILTFVTNLPSTVVDGDLVISRALQLGDGVQVSTGGSRVETDVIAKWDFTELSGNAIDVSGESPQMDLRIITDSNIERMSSGGVKINSGRLQATTASSAKLYDRLTVTGEYSIEAWVVPLNVTQDGPARIVTYSGDTDSTNFMLGQTTYDYDFYARASTTAGDGQPALSTPMNDEVLQATLQHVVVTYSAIDGRRIYVNGQLVSNSDPQGAGNFNSWDRNFAFAVGEEVSNDNQWQGSIRLLAIHERALAAEDIQTNYDIGVGQKFYLLFNVELHTGITRSYVVFQVEQFDDYGYLFNAPFFVSLEPGVTITDVPLEGMRIGVNGKEAPVGQAFANLNTTITQSGVDAQDGRQVLSDVGTIIGVDQGSSIDEFFLTFELLGTTANAFVEATPTAQIPTASTDDQSDIGIKTFDEINEALSGLTGISKTNASVATTFAQVKQQLPVNEDIEGFSAAQQLAITQLAVQYCSELVTQEASPSATGYFGSFDFNAASPAAAFDVAGRGEIISPLLNNLLANTVSSADQPSFADAEAELDGLFTNLIDSCNNPDPGETCTQNNGRVSDMVVAACSAAYGSGMMLIQ